MFPLGTVLVPGMVLPLHVFEQRYRRLVRDCLAGAAELGVVLIRRGSEVGGGDVRTDVGTLARIGRADEQPDGRWFLVAVGERRIRVARWLEDDPYPRAEVVEWPDDPATAPHEAAQVIARIEVQLRRAAALLVELGEPAPPVGLSLAAEPVAASYQAVALGPLGPADRHHLLAAPTVAERFEGLATRLADAIELLQARIAMG